MDLPKIINKAELARRMGIEPQNLQNKLKGTNRQSFTKADKEAMIKVIKDTLEEIKSLPE